jgi:hypothetical protein
VVLESRHRQTASQFRRVGCTGRGEPSRWVDFHPIIAPAELRGASPRVRGPRLPAILRQHRFAGASPGRAWSRELSRYPAPGPRFRSSLTPCLPDGSRRDRGSAPGGAALRCGPAGANWSEVRDSSRWGWRRRVMARLSRRQACLFPARKRLLAYHRRLPAFLTGSPSELVRNAG